MHASTQVSKSGKIDEDLLRTPTNEWSASEVLNWATNIERLSSNVLTCLQKEEIDGEVLLELTEDDIRDFRYRLNYSLTFSELKKLWLSVRALQMRYASTFKNSPATTNRYLQQSDSSPLHRLSGFPPGTIIATPFLAKNCCTSESNCLAGLNRDAFNISPPLSVDGRATSIPPEFFKTGISLGYSFVVTWITSFVMVIVHERVPDMKRYPPLPDIFLDNVPHIPWAFSMCEITGTLLFIIWLCVCIFHKYRTVILRRFFALAGTVFLLRCVTMLITSLSVPGTHLQCNQKDYAIDDTHLSSAEALQLRITRAYIIWSGLGMSIQGVRTCGDYMFSGHTVTLTLLNFFITEYTPRHLYFLHTLTWLLNMFGIFFILAAHEHYSIDVFIAFYITSRLFLYYHTLANNQALMSHDSSRTRIWFPMFSYFENSVDGIIPNEYDTFQTLAESIVQFIVNIKDSFMLTARRIWLEQPQVSKNSKSFILSHTSKQRNVGTSMASSENIINNPTGANADELREDNERIMSLLSENYASKVSQNSSESDESFHHTPEKKDN